MRLALLILLLGVSEGLAAETPFVISASDRQEMPEWLRTVIKLAEDDYRAVLEGKKPIHATPILQSAMVDGGTISYQGNGYTLTVIKRIHNRQMFGMVYGPILKFGGDVFTTSFSDLRFYSRNEFAKLMGVASKESETDTSPSDESPQNIKSGKDNSPTPKTKERTQ